ncbi:beta,beta-carotene 15,15'-monooxygenase [Plakobranchus ocellatus]|uniref:Beta,beta-carotene 15,15'-monooxygenase n=1 Tax=Plakobranchus ocellatus TaxID=259542 RepID=A0AAV3ZA21_9GAST|nr:beta,beta-carotene 15,15'-monooxygenase [Plakobranchus ocellatus]
MAVKMLLHRAAWTLQQIPLLFLFLLLHLPHCQSGDEDQQTSAPSSAANIRDKAFFTTQENTLARTLQARDSTTVLSLNDATFQDSLVTKSEKSEHAEQTTIPHIKTVIQSTELDDLTILSAHDPKGTRNSKTGVIMKAPYQIRSNKPVLTKSRIKEPASDDQPGNLIPVSPQKLLPAKAEISRADLPQATQPLDEGFNLFFKTNPAEMLDVPITFSKPFPTWVNGTLVRNGLGKFENGPRKFLHAFDGFAKIASWRFTGDGTALFSTKFIRSNFYKDSIRSKTIAPYLLFQSVTPPFSIYEKAQCLMNGIDNMNINVYAFKHPKNKKIEYAVLSDFWILYKISLPKLSTKHRVVPRMKQAQHYIAGVGGLGFLNLLSSAHPLPEPGTDNHLTFLSSVAVMPWADHTMKLIRMKSLKRRRVIAQWPVAKLPYMHSFSVTATKAILLASPFFVNVYCMATKVEPFSCLDWHPEEPTTLYVVDLKSGDLTTITMETVFTMHHVNAYDVSDTQIVMDISTYPNPDFVSHLQLHVLMDPVARNSFDAHAKLKRITIDLTKREAHLAAVDPRPVPGIVSLLDMPAINEAYRSRHYCFVYGLVLKVDNVTLSNIAIVKKDLCHSDGAGGGLGDRMWIQPGIYPVEPWFVANPRAAAEDDGLLFIPVLNGVQKTSTLIVLDARTMTLTNSANLPTIIPYSLHGRFFHGV